MQKYTQQTENNAIKNYINTTVKKYIEKNEENVGQIEHVIDYLNAIARKNTDNAEKFEQALKKIPFKTAIAKAEKWIEKLNKQAAKVVEVETDVEVFHDFGDGFRLVKLVGKPAYQREGKLMSHCVGSYFGKDVEIYSLRDIKNNPHCTMEVRKDYNDINQIKGKGNGDIHPKYIGMVLKSLDMFGMKVRDSELTYLGYEDLDKELWKMIDTDFKGAKTITFNNKRFFYKHSKLVQV